MRQVVLWDTACNFNAIILNQAIFNCLITSASTLLNFHIIIVLTVCALYFVCCLVVLAFSESLHDMFPFASLRSNGALEVVVQALHESPVVLAEIISLDLLDCF